MAQLNLDTTREDVTGRNVVANQHIVPNNTGAALTGSSTALAQGLLIPEVTTAPSTAPVPTPAAGCRMLCWCAADSKLYLYNGSAWIKSAALS